MEEGVALAGGSILHLVELGLQPSKAVNLHVEGLPRRQDKNSIMLVVLIPGFLVRQALSTCAYSRMADGGI